jgi:cellulose biosynthesis protein BcsQ
MILTVYNFKGGQGKSKIALNLAFSLGYSIITNDVASQLDDAFHEDEREERFFKVKKTDPIPTDFKSEHNIIYDLGGFMDDRVIPVLEISDFVIVPITYENEDEENIKVGISTIQNIEKYAKKIIIIANKTENEKQKGKLIVNHFDEIKKALEYVEYDKYPIFELKKTKLVSQIEKRKKSIADILASEKPLFQHSYADVNLQFNQIINYLLENSK